MADTYATFMDGLKLAIWQQIAPHINTLPQVQTMEVKVDLYSALEGKADSGARSSGGKGGHGGGGECFSRQMDKRGVVEESPKPNSTMTIAKGKKLKELQKRSERRPKTEESEASTQRG